MTRRLEYAVPDGFGGRSVERILSRGLGMPSGLIGRLRRETGSVLLNGTPCRVTDTAEVGDALTVTVADSVSETVIPTPGPVDIVYMDEDILVADKPPHLPCHPAAGNSRDTLANYLAYMFRSWGEAFTPRIITRLDANTSGLTLLALNPYSAAILNRELGDGRLKKAYFAVTVGVPAETEGEICSNIRRCADSSIKREVCRENEGAAALTRYKVLEAGSGLALLRVETGTGRTHQIRVHLAHAGCPLAGDFLYGREDHSLIPRHALHMGELSLIQPVTGEKLFFRSPMPEDMRRLRERMGEHDGSGRLSLTDGTAPLSRDGSGNHF